MELLKRFWTEEDGMGTVEIVMIIAALMCIALLFRKQVFDFAKGIMDVDYRITCNNGNQRTLIKP